MTDAARIAPPPMATGIPALFVPPRESGDRTSQRAASPPPRPSSPTFRLTCASTSVVASATAGMLVARLGQPCCASAEPGDADRRAEGSLTVHQRLARRCIFVKSRLPDAVDARDGKEQRPRRAASNAAGASGVAGGPFLAAASMTTVGTSSSAYYLPVRRPQSPSPRTNGVKKSRFVAPRITSSASVDASRLEEREPTPRQERRRCVPSPVCPDGRPAVDVLATVAISVAREMRSLPHLR